MLYDWCARRNQKRVKPSHSWNLFTVSFDENADINLYKLHEDDIFRLTPSDSGNPKYLFTPTLRIFDLREFEKIIKKNIIKIVSITTVRIENFTETDKRLSDFDRLFFKLIENDFNSELQKKHSDFYNIDKNVIDDYLSDDNLKEEF